VPEEQRDLLLETDKRIHLQIFPESFVAVLGDLHHDFDADPEGFGALRVYVDANVIISGRAHPLRSVDRLRRELQRSDASESPVEVFEQLIQQLAETVAAVSVKLGDTVEDAEDEILAGRVHDQGKELGRVRRLLARLRRQVNANRSALLPLATRLQGLVNAEQKQRLREAVEHLDAVGQDLELVTERARLLQEEIAGRLGEATNRNLYVLSIVTTAMLPITLITGIFGMNVGGLPFADGKHGFWLVIAVMGATLLGTRVFLKRIGVI
jgi:zinc transporter